MATCLQNDFYSGMCTPCLPCLSRLFSAIVTTCCCRATATCRRQCSVSGNVVNDPARRQFGDLWTLRLVSATSSAWVRWIVGSGSLLSRDIIRWVNPLRGALAISIRLLERHLQMIGVGRIVFRDIWGRVRHGASRTIWEGKRSRRDR